MYIWGLDFSILEPINWFCDLPMETLGILEAFHPRIHGVEEQQVQKNSLLSL